MRGRFDEDHAMPGGRARAATAVLACLFGLLQLIPVAHANAATVDAARQARKLAYDGRCDEALPRIESVRRAEDSAPMALLEGECRIRLRDYAGALTALDAAKQMDADLEDLSLNRGIALYQLGDLADARHAFRNARGKTSQRGQPQLELYEGLLFLQQGDARQAAQSLDRARVMDPGQVEPIASFYASYAWQSLGEREKAREALLRVKAADPDGVFGERADEILAGRTFDERSWFSIEAGLEYDSNVVLLGDAVPVPQGISDEADGRAMWYVEGGAELFNAGKFSGGLVGTYAGNVQFDLREFDIQFPRGGGWVDYELDEYHLFRARYNMGYAWVDYSAFLFTQDASLSMFRNWGKPGNTEFGLVWVWNDYKFPIDRVLEPPFCVNTAPCAPPGADARSARNRDGNSLRPFFLHHYRVRSINSRSLRDIELRGGFAFERYWAKGSDWDFSSYDFTVGARALLFWGIQANTEFVFSYRPFDNPSSYPNGVITFGTPYTLMTEDRLDKVIRVGAHFQKPINDHWSVSTRYLFNRNISNNDPYNYTRHIVGAYAKYRF